MLKRAFLATAIVPLVLAGLLPHIAASARTKPYRPDAWIKLCGESTGCTINPPPHPWKGNDIYNSTGAHQTVAVRIEEGEGVRFWIKLQNDGTADDTVTVQGCSGTRQFKVNKVILGKQKAPHSGTTDVTKAYKNGTLSFDLKASDSNSAVFTLNIIESSTAKVGFTSHCNTTITSKGDTSLSDTVVTKMTAV